MWTCPMTWLLLLTSLSMLIAGLGMSAHTALRVKKENRKDKGRKRKSRDGSSRKPTEKRGLNSTIWEGLSAFPKQPMCVVTTLWFTSLNTCLPDSLTCFGTSCLWWQACCLLASPYCSPEGYYFSQLLSVFCPTLLFHPNTCHAC